MAAGCLLAMVTAGAPAGARQGVVRAGTSASAVAVVAWGADSLGDGTDVPRWAPATRALLPPGVQPTAISAGQDFSLATGSDGKLYAWGTNSSGQLGDGTATSHSTPVSVHLPAGVSPVRIAAGWEHSLTVGSDGKLYAWGENTIGELGQEPSGASLIISTPVTVHLPAGVSPVQIAAGFGFSLATGTDGKLYAWGYNDFGELGDGTVVSRFTPRAVHLPAGVSAVRIAAREEHSLAIGSDGKLYTWGDGKSTPVTVHLPAGVSPVQIAAGGAHSLTVGSDGKLYAWGANNYGQLGDGTMSARSTPVTVLLPAGVIPTAIAAGHIHSLTAGSDGKLYTWGDNSAGQLGDGTDTRRTRPTAVLLPPGLTPNSVAAGEYHNLMITPAPSVNTTVFRSVTPARLLDTRPGATTVDGRQQGGGKVPAGGVATAVVTSRGGLPANPVAVAVNVTVSQPEAPGYLTVFACGSPRPLASNLNFQPGQSVANLVVANPGTGGALCVFTSARTDLIVDATGYYLSSDTYHPLTPARLVDTRPGRATVDGQEAGAGKITPSEPQFPMFVAGRGGVPDNVDAVVLNVTITQPDAAGYVAVAGCFGLSLPERTPVSNINVVPGQTVANMIVAAPLFETGRPAVCLSTTVPTHVIIDVEGYYAPLASYVAPLPVRLLDTRPGRTTIDGQQVGIGEIPAKETVQVAVQGRADVPATGTAAVVNVTVTQPDGPGYITAYPCGSPVPHASNINYRTGQTVAGLVMATLAPSGRVCLYTSARTHLIADLQGYYPN